MRRNLLSTLILVFICGSILAQPATVSKTYNKPVLMHYMPWFDSPQYGGSWGYHWTMANKNPNVIVDAATGKRQIASHFYPMIGPYDCQDPDIIEYHLLLMKYAGIDGVIVDWYGVQGSNGDVGSLLTNSNALIDRTDEAGLKFALILEDRFTASVAQGQANMAYARDNYFNRSGYFRHGSGNDPLVGVFGPITFQTPSQWSTILASANEDVEFLPLWYEAGDAGSNSDGEYLWIYEENDDYYQRMQAYYQNRAASMKTVMGVAYPGFKDFYAQGGAGSSYFEIPHNGTGTLSQTLGLVNQNSANIDILQLATWNDYGEGTIFEPTFEFGFSFLTTLQQFLGVSYGIYELQQIHRMYNLRKQYAGNSSKQNQLNQAYNHFVALRVGDAVAMLNTVEGGTTNGAPNSNAGSDKNLAAGTTSVTLNGSGTDPDGNSLTYSWSKISGPSVNINNTTSATTSISGLTNGSTYVFRLTVSDGSLTGSDDVSVTVNQASVSQSPYSGSPINLPGTVEIENYDFGGEGVAYHDVDTNNAGGQGRTGDGVDLENCSAGGLNVGWTSSGEWMEYTVNVASAGTYNFEFRVASTNAGGTFHVEFNNVNKTGTVTGQNTGAWQTWASVYANNISLSAGVQVMKLALDNPNHNIDKIIVTNAVQNVPVTGVNVSPTSASIAVGATQQLTATVFPANASNKAVTWSTSNGSVASVSQGGIVTGLAAGNATITVRTNSGNFTETSAITVTATSNQTPYSGSPINLPGTVEIENYDNGGEGIAYHDVDTNNAGGQGRTNQGVDLENCSSGGLNVGWTSAGEWMEYSVNVTITGVYNFEFRVASPNAGGTLHVEFNGVNKTGTVTGSNTGGWQTWTSVFANNISLNAGVQIMKIALDNPNHNIDKVIITGTSQNVPVASVSVSPSSVSIGVGSTQQLTTNVLPSNASNKSVTWATSNGSVALVSQSGIVTGVAVGNATITVTTQDGGFMATRSVTVTTTSTTAGYQIRNRWQNSYLQDGGANVTYAATASGNNFVWILEDVGGGNVEIKNAGTGEYMHIENLTGSIQCTSRTSGWSSSRWAFETVDATYRKVRNAWQSTHYIHVENLTGNAQHGTINTAWQSAQWAFEAVGGAREIGFGTQEAQVVNNISVYPNPATETSFTLQLDEVSVNGYHVEIIDFTGRRIFTNHFELNSVEIETDRFGAGVYLIRVLNGSSTMTTKLILKQ